MIQPMEIDSKYYSTLSRFFSPIVLDSIAQKGYSSYLNEVYRNIGLFDKIDPTITFGEFIDCIYDFLFKNYRNEYVYKNVIANKILLNKHSLNTTQMLTEFRVGKSKADVVLLNGYSTVYEIKSQFDSFVRLEAQISSYFEIFDYVNVITTFSQAHKLKFILPKNTGILVLTDKNTISTIRNAKSNIKNINLSILFDSLRKTEYLSIIKNYYGVLPNVPNTQIYQKCKKLFCEIPLIKAHDLTIRVLKNRNNSKRLKYFIDKAPSSLSAYAMSICNKKDNVQNLLDQLDKDVYSLVSYSCAV